MSHEHQVNAMIETIKRRATLPTNQNLFQSSDFCSFLSDELQSNIVAQLMAQHNEHFVVYDDISITAGLDEYDIPHRAIGNKLRDVVWLNSDGSKVSLPYISIEQESNQNGRFFWPAGFTIRGNSIILLPEPTIASTLRVYYFRLPNRLAPLDEGAYVTDVNTGTGVITLDTDVSDYGWTTDTALDVTQTTPPFDAVIDDMFATVIGTTTITVDLADAAEITVGDCICEAGYAFVAQIPQVLYPLLIEAAVLRCLEAKGDPLIEVAAQKYSELSARMFALTAPRIDGQPQKIITSTLADHNTTDLWSGRNRAWWSR